MKIPVLRYHAPTKQWYVWNGAKKKRETFGGNADEARRRYAGYVAALLGGKQPVELSSITVADAANLYNHYADTHYAHSSRERSHVKLAMDMVIGLFGNQPAAFFRARALKEVRTALLHGGKKKARSRRYVNRLVSRIQTAWRWLASDELIPAECAHSVCMVKALQPGEGGKERPRVMPPHENHVAAILPHCSPTVAAMLRVQLLTGARPGEIRNMRWEEISRSPSQPVPVADTGRAVAALKCGETTVWMYAPATHKTIKRGKAKVIPIGPRAQAVLFSTEQIVPHRTTGLVFPAPSGTAYRDDSYARAVERACKAAGVPRWAPNALRHKAASDIAETFDDHTAASVLGHAAGSGATRVYVEQAIRKAAEAAAKVG